MLIINILVYSFLVYMGMGVVVGLVIIGKGLKVIDPVTSGSSLGFKLIIYPAVVALWLPLVFKWIKTSGND